MKESQLRFGYKRDTKAATSRSASEERETKTLGTNTWVSTVAIVVKIHFVGRQRWPYRDYNHLQPMALRCFKLIHVFWLPIFFVLKKSARLRGSLWWWSRRCFSLFPGHLGAGAFHTERCCGKLNEQTHRNAHHGCDISTQRLDLHSPSPLSSLQKSWRSGRSGRAICCETVGNVSFASFTVTSLHDSHKSLFQCKTPTKSPTVQKEPSHDEM